MRGDHTDAASGLHGPDGSVSPSIVLHLVAPTAPAWVTQATAHLDELLIDLAHCEKKAASTIVSLLFRYPEAPGLAATLSPIAREELTHFEDVLAHLARRGVALRHLVPAPYAKALLAAARPGEPGRLVDTLLCLALIEARSCERMQLLAEAITDPDTAALYRRLVASEARHHATYVTLAGRFAPTEAEVSAQLAMLARHEATLLTTVADGPPVAGDPPGLRMHSRVSANW
jgi:tRNA-(ms[2]io[6]A)-hydroxylase